jgi:hypothetical protein
MPSVESFVRFFSYYLLAIIASYLVIYRSFGISKEKHKQKKFLQVLGGFMIVAIFLSIFILEIIMNFCIGSRPKLHLSTNIITNQCVSELGYCAPRKSWYKIDGCDNLSKEEKIDIFNKNSGRNTLIAECNSVCDKAGRELSYMRQPQDGDGNFRDAKAYYDVQKSIYCKLDVVMSGMSCADLNTCKAVDCTQK